MIRSREWGAASTTELKSAERSECAVEKIGGICSI